MIKLFVICSIQFFLLINNLSAQTGYELAKKLDNKDKPQNMTSRISMTLTNAKNKSRKNVMISKTANQSQKLMIWVLEPKFDRGMSFLKIEHDDRKTEMRIWLPAFNKIRRINANRRSNSFMGSDLSYEDMMSRSIDDNTYLRLEDDQIGEEDCYVLEVIPKKRITTSYSKHRTWISKENFQIVQETSFDKKSKLKKIKKFHYAYVNDYEIISKIYVEDLQKKHKTDIYFDQVKVDTKMDEKIFQEKNLKRLPLN